MENKKIVNDNKYCECYWNNLDVIHIVAIHRWQELNEDESKWIDFEEIKISKIGTNNEGRWFINQFTDIDKCKSIMKDLQKHLLVRNWIFPRAFKDIYNEMKIHFKMTRKDDQLTMLESLFTI